MVKKDKRTQFEKNRPQWDESRYDYIDVVVSSGKIRQMFFQRCKDLKLDPYTVAMKVGITFNSFKKNYVKTSKPRCTKY